MFFTIPLILGAVGVNIPGGVHLGQASQDFPGRFLREVIVGAEESVKLPWLQGSLRFILDAGKSVRFILGVGKCEVTVGRLWWAEAGGRGGRLWWVGAGERAAGYGRGGAAGYGGRGPTVAVEY